jgi:uncharacterized protein
MSEFIIRALNPVNNTEKKFKYNNETSELVDLDGEIEIKTNNFVKYKEAFATSIADPVGKSKKINILKIQLGLSCNYECSYCNQRFVPHADETNLHNVEPFLEQLETWFDGGERGDGTGVRIEFWGGEPLVYWKTLKPLAEKLRERYPNAQFGMVTNASILTPEINEWIDSMDFGIGLSHDGPGYHVRGLDPLDDPEKFKLIKDLYDRLKVKNKISINAMLHKDNRSRAEISTWLRERFGEDVIIGEGAFIDPYDEGGISSSIQSVKEQIEYRNQALVDIRNKESHNFTIIQEKVQDFIRSVVEKRPASSLGQKCGMDNPSNISVDLRGNVLTCQNVSEVSIGPNGESHKIGHVSDFDNIKLKTSTHFSKRDECMKCPVLQVCKGSCMFLHGPLWEVGCNNSFSDSIPFFSAAFEVLTGYIPFYIDGPQREDRKDVYGLVNGIPKEEPKKKIIPIMSI